MANLEPRNTMALMESQGQPIRVGWSCNNARVASDITYYAYALKFWSTPEHLRVEVEEEEVMEEEILSSGEKASDGEGGNDLDLGNFSRIDHDDLDLPDNEKQIFQALENGEVELEMGLAQLFAGKRKQGRLEEQGNAERLGLACVCVYATETSNKTNCVWQHSTMERSNFVHIAYCECTMVGEYTASGHHQDSGSEHLK
ncbi:hypothetical protein CAEBREN_14694 [Caenorhabditis brenneri]|uniref:Uncharacterized protein n=1 Tax=Caenorhabditis brenneri TaxID=135651 RepID=G0MB62_CAEBE|nr:hypothetical protein CAEBREN_14694 [Caenorhabditis brenneri]